MATTTGDVDDMKAETPLMAEHPLPRNKTEEQILGALMRLDQRMSSLETTQTQRAMAEAAGVPVPAEKHYPASASESWQNLSSDGGTK